MGGLFVSPGLDSSMQFSSLRSLVLLAGAIAIPTASLSAKEVTLRQWPAKAATPALKLTDLTGKEWDLQALRGKVVVLNFWATWCEPCVEELPVFNDLASGPARDGVVVLGVNYKDSADAIDRFAQAHPFQYPVLRDKSGDAFKAWTSGVMPTTVLVDRKGRARWRMIGELGRGDAGFKKALDKMLEK